MSKGYNAYLFRLSLQIDRELEREINKLEIPYLKESFIQWMKENKDVSESAIKNYLHWILKLDTDVFPFDEDFFQELRDSFENKDYEKIKSLLSKYDIIITKEIEAAKNEKLEYPAKSVSDWRSAFRKYADFILWEIENIKNADKQKLIDTAQKSADNLFMREQFINWAIHPDNPDWVSLETAQTYASRIRSVNKTIFCKSGKDYLALIAGLVKNHNIDNITTMFELMDKILTKRIDKKNESELNLNELNNARSALRLYFKFIKSILNSQN